MGTTPKTAQTNTLKINLNFYAESSILPSVVTRIDAIEKVTGQAIYAGDIYLAGMLYAVPLHAKYPHAKILEIDISKALKIAGVVDIITAKDVKGEKRFGTVKKDHYFFASDKTRYAGDVIAMVAATSLEEARAGRDAIEVKYEPLPTVFSPKEALKKDAPRIHPEKDNNICAEACVRHGNTEAGFAESDKIIEREYRTQHIEHAYMEPEACIAIAGKDGGVAIRGGMQHPFTAQKFVAAATGLPLDKVQIIQTTLGGGFGGKDDTISLICARTAILALRTKRPIKVVYTREESIRESYKRHPFSVRYKAGVKGDGTLNALEADITTDSGAYCSTSPFVIWRPTVQCTGPYIYPNVKCDSRAVYTNNTFTGAMRGFGSPQINFAIESFMDEIAAELNMDPIELRRKNFFTQSCTIHTGQTLDKHTVSTYEVVKVVLDKFGWGKKFAKCSRGRPDSFGNYYGVGMACSYRGVSLGAEGDDYCAAKIEIAKDGKIYLEVGVAENGQGLKTAMANICARELGVPIEKIVYKDVDTLRLPDSRATVASRGTLAGGNAVIAAARKIKNGAKIALGEWRGPKTSWDEEKGQGEAYFTYVYGCNAVELAVDGKTGIVHVEKVVAAHDMGHAVNPQMAEGQVYGGIIMGMGFALKEEVIHKNGIIQNTNFDKYKITTSSEVPTMEAIIVENPDDTGPWGAKSLGEPVNELMGGAIANAIYYATGVRFRELPITAERVRKCLSV